MATIRKNEFGYYFIDFTTGSKKNGDYKRLRETLDTKDRREAKIRLDERINELKISPVFSRMTVEQFKKDYFRFSKSRKSIFTAEKEKFALQLLQQYYPSVKYIDEYTPKMADDFITGLSQREIQKRIKKRDAEGNVIRDVRGKIVFGYETRLMSPHGINSNLSAIRSAFSTALVWKAIQANPFSGVRKITIDEEHNARILSLDELKTFFSKAYEIRPLLADAYEFYLFTGMRRSEALRIEWPDFNWSTNLLIIRKAKKRKGRTIFLLPRARQVLENRRTLPKPFDFKPHRMSDAYRDIADECGIEGTTLHDLRKSYSSYLQAAGMPITMVAMLIGDSKETTEEFYTGYHLEMIRNYMMQFQTNMLSTINPLLNSAQNTEIKSA